MLGSLKRWFKSSSIIATSFILLLTGTIFIIVGFAVEYYFEVSLITLIFQETLVSLGQTFISVAILLGVFQVAIIQEEILNFLSDLLSDTRFLKHLEKNSLKKLTEQSLNAYAENIKDASFIRQFIDMIESNDDHYVENLQIVYSISEDSSGEIKLCKKVSKTVEIVATDRTDLSSLIKKTISTRVSFEEESDSLELEKIEIRIGSIKILLEEEELEEIIQREEEKESPGYSIKYIVNIEKLIKKIKSVHRDKDLDIENITPGTRILLEVEEIRKTSLKGNKIVHRLPALTKGLVVSVYTDGKIKVDGELFVNNARKSQKNIIKKKLGNSLYLSTKEWIFPGNGYIIVLHRD